jgi:hypothetical protein
MRCLYSVQTAAICGRTGTNADLQVKGRMSVVENPARRRALAVSLWVWQPSKNHRHGRNTHR